MIPIRHNALIQTRHDIAAEEAFDSTATARMKDLRNLCEAFGSKMIMLVPPTPSSENAVHKLAGISEKNGVPVWVPIDASTLTARHYEPDAFHLNSEGAGLFT